jgi:ATP-dependent helicase/nuclease subunit B
VTPDRALARRVAAELSRWKIKVEDSAGVSLTETDAGLFARLVARAAAAHLAPVPLIAMLRHPLVKFGAGGDAVDILEMLVLRGPRPARDVGLVRAAEDATADKFHPHDPRKRMSEAQRGTAIELAKMIVEKIRPLTEIAEAASLPIGRLIEAHRAALAAFGFDLARSAHEYAGRLHDALTILAETQGAVELSLADYAETLTKLLAGQKNRPPIDPAARVCILGALEARLLDFDRMVIGGVNEGVWPPEAQNDSWLNRPIRKKLRLDLPERRVGLNAHDFAQAANAREVVITRARRQDGVETVASRFLQRIKAVAPEQAWDDATKRGEKYLALTRALETPLPAARATRPEPRPPVELRPVRLSVTEVEAFIRDPYTIYARHILRLPPLEALDAEPDAADRGTLLHDALGKFTEEFPGKLPQDALERLLALGKQAFGKFGDFPEVRAVWWPRFERVAHWFLSQEPARRKGVARIIAEKSGSIRFDIGGREFTLAARADRIDLRDDKSVVILDYKTGAPPSAKEAIVGLAPQLPLEAAIVRSGGFQDIPANARVADIQIMRLSGGDPPGEPRSFHPDEMGAETRKLFDELKLVDLDGLADFSLKMLKARLAKFADARTPYMSVPRAKWRSRFGEYDHLARIKEWSESGGGFEE